LPADFVKQLKTYLEEWTGLAWNIELQKSEEASAASLKAQKDKVSSDQAAALTAHDTVQKALSLFPKAEIINIMTTSDA
jgi:hypothetical protein